MKNSLKMKCLMFLDKIESLLNSNKRIVELEDKISNLEREIETLKITKLYVMPNTDYQNKEQWCYSCLKNVTQSSSCMSTNCPFSTGVTSGVTM